MVEIIKCPNCQRQLQVPAEHLGQTVQCPECRGMFVARVTTVSAQPMPAPAPTKPRHDDVDELPRRRRRERDDFDDDDDDDFGDYRQPRGLRNRLPAHRGGMILAIGLVALVGGFSFCVPVLLGPVAWVMGSWDLHEIREGRMDPEGEGLTRAGQICGIVATVLLLLSLPLVYFWIMLINGGL